MKNLKNFMCSCSKKGLSPLSPSFPRYLSLIPGCKSSSAYGLIFPGQGTQKFPKQLITSLHRQVWELESISQKELTSIVVILDAMLRLGLYPFYVALINLICSIKLHNRKHPSAEGSILPSSITLCDILFNTTAVSYF